MRRIAISGLLAAFGVVACSGADSSPLFEDAGLRCGAGTESVNGECVVSRDSGADVSSTDDASRLPDGGHEADVEKNDDDACPTAPIVANCSDSCGGPLNCDKVRCRPEVLGDSNLLFYKIDIPENGSVVLRTPHHPAQDPKCLASCEGDTVARSFPPEKLKPGLFAMLVRVNGTRNYRVRVGAPWHITPNPGSSFPKYPQYCTTVDDIAPSSKPPCFVYYGREGRQVVVWTYDTNAPAANVVIEDHGSQDVHCQ